MEQLSWLPAKSNWSSMITPGGRGAMCAHAPITVPWSRPGHVGQRITPGRRGEALYARTHQSPLSWQQTARTAYPVGDSSTNGRTAQQHYINVGFVYVTSAGCFAANYALGTLVSCFLTFFNRHIIFLFMWLNRFCLGALKCLILSAVDLLFSFGR